MSLRQWLWLGLLSCCWGSAFILMEIALPMFSPVTIVTGRLVVATIVMGGVLWSQASQRTKLRSLPPSVWFQCGGLSLLNNLLPFWLVGWAQQHISANLASILIASAPIFTVVMAVFWLGEPLTLVRSLGVTLGFAGVVVLVGPEVLSGLNLEGFGELAALVAAMAYAVSGFIGARFQKTPPQIVSTLTVAIGAMIILPFALLSSVSNGGFSSSPLITGWQWSSVLALLALGVIPTAIAYFIYFRMLGEVGVLNTSLVSFLVPLSVLILSAVFLHERVDTLTFVGMSLILGGLAVLDGRLLKRLQV